jgi:hypothetical protein
MLRRILVFMVLVLGISAVAVSQQDACKAVEIPVGVINFGGESFRGLAAQDFLAHPQKGSITVKSIAYDNGPRRVLLVVDTSKKLSANLRKVEVELVKTLVAASRPEDSLGLLPARGPGSVVKFGDPRTGLVDAIQDTNSQQRKDRGVLDTVLEGIEWFSDSHPGDAIIVIAPDTEGNHKANAKSVANALAEHHIRLFGLALGPIQTRNSTTSSFYTSTTSQGLSLAQPSTGDLIYNTGDENFFPLTQNSGGLVTLVADPDSTQFSDNVSDPQVLQRVRFRALTITNAIDAFYRVVVEPQRVPSPGWWSLDLAENIKKNSPRMFLLYPTQLGPCSQVAAK